MNKAVIRWSGSKRGQADKIVKYFPNDIDTYYEPFVGGASVLVELLSQNTINIKNYSVSDINSYLIGFYNLLVHDVDHLYRVYCDNWNYVNSVESDSDKNLRYLQIRDRFNKSKDSADFFFITKTCYTGLIRYNSSGDFNVGYHYGRCGEKPESVLKILHMYSELFNMFNVSFTCRDFSNIEPCESDFVYFDPPYAETKKTMYSGDFSHDRFYSFCKSLQCKYAISFNGQTGDNDRFTKIPNDLYTDRIDIVAGRSFRSGYKIKDNATTKTFDSLYINYGRDCFVGRDAARRLF